MELAPDWTKTKQNLITGFWYCARAETHAEQKRAYRKQLSKIKK